MGRGAGRFGVAAQTEPAGRPGERLRIGYEGSFFGSPNWMKMFMGVINAHDRDQFEVHLIVDGALPSRRGGLSRSSGRPDLGDR